ncbi:hypothetical protein BX661DRAFT_183278 [Kickxella alabastrina]|uniref:uncharacterized protein n=1 Tax=Kickxella alabastrina TaxID=61397 RepID=UPI002220AEB1|nr:uncharacterized protein BX661DRAFT_183278 [Kickxella alabastrina]KAI7826693.1 hypothetical protein BX661DRAFT_183278 [Kickxella alabastrina]
MITSSILPPIDIPNTNLVNYVFTECESHVSSSTEHTTLRLAAGLQQAPFNIGPGDTVAIFAANGMNYPIAAYAIVAAGATCTPANPMELAHQLTDSRCKMIIVGEGLQPTVDRALAHSSHAAGKLREIPAYLCYSSGTTGRPKGVLLTHRNMVANAMQINGIKQFDSGAHTRETFLGLAPFCHAYGLSYVLHSSVAQGGTIVIMAAYTFEKFLSAIQHFKITYGYLVPPIVCALSKNPHVDEFDLTSMHTVLSGGAALSPTLIETTEARLPGVRIVQGYGMSEMSPATTMLSTSHCNPASIGILLAGCQAKVIDDTGTLLGCKTPGELCFRGPNIMLGYLNNPKATEDIFDSDGFLHTGDIGYFDQNGFFYITDRKKELIKYKGFQVAPSELEGILAEHPDVEDAVVMAVYDDEQATEIPKAYIVLRNKAGGKEDQDRRARLIVDWLHERVARYKWLRGGFAVISHIPRSPAGKIVRSSLRNIEHVSSRTQS